MVYTPTNSKLHHFNRNYAPLLAGELKDLFKLDDEAMSKRLFKCNRYEQAVNGNLQVDGYVSADKQFISLRLYQFSQIDYQPISERHYLQGEAAAQALLADYRKRYRAQLPSTRGTRPDPQAPIDKNTKEPKRYFRLDNFIRSMVYQTLKAKQSGQQT